MDLSTITQKLHEGKYGADIRGFVRDVRQIFMNAVIYNEPSTDVYTCAVKLSNVFELLLRKTSLPVPMPLGLGRSTRWTGTPLGWRRVEQYYVFIRSHPRREETLVWKADGIIRAQRKKMLPKIRDFVRACGVFRGTLGVVPTPVPAPAAVPIQTSQTAEKPAVQLQTEGGAKTGTFMGFVAQAILPSQTQAPSPPK